MNGSSFFWSPDFLGHIQGKHIALLFKVKYKHYSLLLLRKALILHDCQAVRTYIIFLADARCFLLNGYYN